ncbi:MAG: glycoside hydrolase family 65 protein [Tenericutes bacterium]|nr:glycoside hydrolase family 65 protein [Mycoplasmatota bacterium]
MWEIKTSEFNRDKIIHHGNQFLTGHLMLGVRGTLDEYRKEQLVAINCPLVYDQVGNGWREPVNAFNPLYTKIQVNQESIDVLNHHPIKHDQILNIKDSTMARHSVFKKEDMLMTIDSKRFVSAVDQRAIIGVYHVSTNKDATIEILTGIDTHIWDINGPHIEMIKTGETPYLKAYGVTHEKGYKIQTLKKIDLKFEPKSLETITTSDGVFYNIRIDAKANETYTFHQYAVIGVNEDDNQLQATLEKIVSDGHDHRLIKHQQAWDKRWMDADVLIEGDNEAQLALRYSIYHLLLLSPSIYKQASIPARGISGQTYKGAIFWDTEIFMLPFYLNTDIKSAKHIIDYRIHGLKGAKEKAKSYGFKGAFYAWESQEHGYDACTDYNVTDVFTKRRIRTYFKDKQVHISADIVYAIQTYIHRTNDYSILKEGALEVILEVARFYLDYGKYSILDDRFEVWDVMGPDEYHERVHNNAFTNRMVKMVFDTVVHYEAYFKKENDKYFDELVHGIGFKKPLHEIHQIKDKVYQKEISKHQLIEQFDGYFNFRDVSLKDIFKNKLHENEYLGGHGLAGDTQIIKQADVITMLYLFRDDFDLNVMEANWKYYEPRTEHGSSLSASMYALVACMIGNPEYAYPLFMKSATVDLTGISKTYAGDIYIGGTHPAASGGAYMTAIYGFSGLSLTDKISVNPQLPKSIQSLTYKIIHQGKKYQIYVSNKLSEIKEIQL